MKLKVTTSECVSINGLCAGVFFWPENRRKTVETRQSMDWRLECFVCHRNHLVADITFGWRERTTGNTYVFAG